MGRGNPSGADSLGGGSAAESLERSRRLEFTSHSATEKRTTGVESSEICEGSCVALQLRTEWYVQIIKLHIRTGEDPHERDERNNIRGSQRA